MNFSKRCWVEVHLDAIENNVAEIKKIVPDSCKTMAIVKANGYGHGIIPAANACIAGGADWLGVAIIEEAVKIRENDIETPTLILGITPIDYIDSLIDYNIDQTIGDYAYAKQLSDIANKRGKKVNVHIKIDTGMNRLGISALDEDVTKAVAEVKKICSLSGLNVKGMYTHLSSSRPPNPESIKYTNRQLKLFEIVCDTVENEGIEIPLRHCLNSAGILNYPDFAMDMVRAGHTLYEKILKFIPGEQPAIRNAMDMFASIIFIKDIPKGSKIGYARQHTLERDSKVAVIGMGYADGYNRSLSNCGEVILHGKRVKVLGGVCMDLFMIDVTDIDDARVGDVITIAGKDGDEQQSMYQLMVQSGVALNPPAICISTRIPIIYKRDGEIVGYANNKQTYPKV